MPSFKSPLNRWTYNVFERQDMELRTSRLIETCSNSFKDKTEDGWVVTRAKTKVSGRLNFVPLHQNVLDGLPHSIRPQWYFRQVAAGEQLTFHYQGGLKVSTIAIAMHCLDIYAKSVEKKLWPVLLVKWRYTRLEFSKESYFPWKHDAFQDFPICQKNCFCSNLFHTRNGI